MLLEMRDALTAKSPGEAIKELLSRKGLTQVDLAIITGLSRQSINYIITGRTSITAEIAMMLATAFDNNPSEWLELENQYRLSLVQGERMADLENVERRTFVMQIAPIRDMQRRGWIKDTKDFDEIERELKRFFQTNDLCASMDIPVAFHKSARIPSDDKAVRAWLYRAIQIAKAMHVEKFDSKKLEKAEKELKRVAAFAKETYRVPQILAKYGIRFIVIEHLPHTKVDGAAFWLNENSPVIVVSIRFDRIDSFWFTLMHEVEHIKNRDAISIDNDIEETAKLDVGIDEIERRANEGAAASLIEPAELESFIRRVSPLYSREKIVQFAHRIKIHPGIIIGQLQHRKEIGFNTHRQLLAKVRDTALETALTDGWGKTLPLAI
jgi:HTH-type transcriptional regulator/antitoxin HigA